MRRPTTRQVGLLILCAAALLFVFGRPSPPARSYHPLLDEVSLKPGKSLHRFKVDVNAHYFIILAIENREEFDGHLDCLLGLCEKQPSPLHAKWVIRQNGKMIGEGSTEGDRIGWSDIGLQATGLRTGPVYLPKGEYSLELNVLQDAGVLNAGNPRVVAQPDDFEWYAATQEGHEFRPLALFIGTVGLIVALLPQHTSLYFLKFNREADASKPRRWRALLSRRRLSSISGRFLGTALLLVAPALYFGSEPIYDLFTFTALDAPMSMSNGEKQTFEFRINQAGQLYFLDIYVPEKAEHNSCWLVGDAPEVRWSLLQGGERVAVGTSRDWYMNLGGFVSVRGRYKLTLDSKPPRDCLSALHPHIRVVTYDDGASDWIAVAKWMAGIAGLTGLALFLISFRRPLQKLTEEPAPDRVLVISYRHPLARMSFPTYGYIAAIFFGSAMMVMMVITGNNHLSRGVWVRLRGADRAISSDPNLPPVVIHVSTAVGQRSTDDLAAYGNPGWQPEPYVEHFRLDGEDLDQKQLAINLRELLVTRSDRTVYIEGEEDMPFYALTDAIDVARSSYASRVVLLPKTSGSAPATSEKSVDRPTHNP